MIKREGYVIWPIYFDESVSRSRCRRVGKRLAVRNPDAEQIASAAKRLGWQVEIEPGSHPAYWWKRTGKVIVKPGKPMKKGEVIRLLALELGRRRRR
ncbi:MAG: signal recognition particle subunit SRP19/SEC65 family protein [Thaumarchaeota archaeon]|nr:signal recognition particle subunit SRP19/SEC65 family protein [Nitrososphaerota archaeon]